MATTQTNRSSGRSGGSKGGNGGGKTNGKSGGRGRGASASGETATGERDENYNLVSVLYHALQGAETYEQYIADADAAGDQELAEFFTEVQAEERDRGERAKALLAARIGSGEDEDE